MQTAEEFEFSQCPASNVQLFDLPSDVEVLGGGQSLKLERKLHTCAPRRRAFLYRVFNPDTAETGEARGSTGAAIDEWNAYYQSTQETEVEV